MSGRMYIAVVYHATVSYEVLPGDVLTRNVLNDVADSRHLPVCYHCVHRPPPSVNRALSRCSPCKGTPWQSRQGKQLMITDSEEGPLLLDRDIYVMMHDSKFPCQLTLCLLLSKESKGVV